MQNRKLLFQIPLLALGVLVLFSFGFNTAAAADASSIYVSTQGNDTWNGQSATYNDTTGSGPKATINNATGTVTTNGTVYIANGTYNESGININTNMKIIGESQQNTLINGTNNYGNSIFHIASGVNVNISNLTLTGNYGAIWNDGTLTVDNCNFTGNTAFYGGAIWNDGTLTVDNCNFTGNTALYGGGAIYSEIDNYQGTEPVTLTVNNCTFTGNNANSGNGGAIYSHIGGYSGALTATVNNCTFTRNNANSGNGGAIYSAIYPYSGGPLATTMDKCTFTDNNATYYGGAVYNYIYTENGGALTATMNNCTFTDNNATSEGGAVYNCICTKNGGALTATMDNNSFTDNNVNSGNGGAVYNYIDTENGRGALTATMDNNSFTSNNANSGGAVYNYIYSYQGTGLTVTVNNNSFTSNNATSGNGGAIFSEIDIYSGTEITVTGSNNSFTSNNATSGGAVYNYIYSSQGTGTITATMDNCTFTHNNATYNGGAVYDDIYNYQGTGTLTAAVNNCTFTGNSAEYGGAIYTVRTLTVHNSSFTGNSAEYGGAIYNDDGVLAVSNSTFTSNSASYNGGAIYSYIAQGDGGTLKVDNSTLMGNNVATDGYGGAIYSYNNSNNVTVNFNRIVGNGPNEIYSDTGTLNATLNWWGSNADPSVYVSGVNGGSVNVTSWLVLNITADPSSIICGGNSTVTTDLQYDSGILSDPGHPERYHHDPAAGHVPDVPVSFTATNGSINPVPGALVSGNATTMFTATHGGTGNVTATVDSQSVSALITINPISTVLVVGNATVTDGQNATLNATLTDGNGNPLGQQPVTFNVNGTGYSAVTGADGVATVQYPSSHAGTYPVTVSYSGTADYAASCGAETLTVDPASYLYMNVTTSNGNPTVGQTFVVTYKLSNSGPDNATNVVMTLQVPEGLEFVTANVDSGAWSYNATNRTLTWTLENVPVGDPYLNITMESLSAGTQTINGPSLTSGTFNINTHNMPTITIDTQAQQNNNNGSTGTITNGSNTVNAATHEVAMQKTGAPLAELVLAILAVLGGVLVPRRK